LTASVIHNDLVVTLGEEAIASRTMMECLREAQIAPGFDDSDEAILRTLEELPFSSVRKLSCAIHLPKTTVYRRFSEKLGFIARHLR
jgi:hypothetical protein